MSDFAKDTNVPTNDCISRQVAIDVIEKLFPTNTMRNDYTEGITVGVALALDFIKQLPSAQQWTPVSEGLPKKGGWYLVTWEDQFKTVRGVTVSEFIDPKGLTDIGHFEGFVMNEIIAWMPLPEPWKGGE